MISRRSFLAAATAGALCRPAFAASQPEPPLRDIAAARGLLYGSYLDWWDFQAQRDYEALAAREAFLSSASTFVLPVVSIDGAPVGDGTPGPIATRLRQLYLEFARRTAT